MAIFTFNPNGANIAAKKAAAAGIPLVATDNVGQVLKSGSDVVAAIDFDWAAMGKDVAQYIAKNYPGEDVAVITGLFEHIPVQMFRAAFEPEVKELGKNKIVAIRDGRYDPNEAVNQVQDLIQSGQKFGVLFVFNDEMGVAVTRALKSRGLLNNPIKVITTNGAPYGIAAMKEGDIKYSISSSPGWEGMISFLALQDYVTGKSKDKNQEILLPIAPITPATIDDKTKVIPWDVDPVWLQLTEQYFPQYKGFTDPRGEGPRGRNAGEQAGPPPAAIARRMTGVLTNALSRPVPLPEGEGAIPSPRGQGGAKRRKRVYARCPLKLAR